VKYVLIYKIGEELSPTESRYYHDYYNEGSLFCPSWRNVC